VKRIIIIVIIPLAHFSEWQAAVVTHQFVIFNSQMPQPRPQITTCGVDCLNTKHMSGASHVQSGAPLLTSSFKQPMFHHENKPPFLPHQLIWKCSHRPNIIAGYYLVYLLSQDKKIASRPLLVVQMPSVNNRIKVQGSTFALRQLSRNITFWTLVAFHGCKLLRSNI